MSYRTARWGMLMVAAILGALALGAGGVGAQVAGTWEVALEGPRGPRTMTVVIATEGVDLTGVATMAPPAGRRGPQGGGPPGGRGAEAREVELSEGRVDGMAFQFTLTMSMRGNEISQEFAGTVEGDEMTGTVTTPRGEQPFSGERVN